MKQEPLTNSGTNRLENLRAQRARRRRRRRVSTLITLLAIALLIGAAVLILNGGMLSALLDGHSAVESPEPVRSEAGQYSTVTIAAVGSISVSDHQLSDARQDDGYDFSPCFFGAASLLSGADLTVGNLECNFAGAPYGTATVSAPTELADTLAGLGFDLLQTANCTSIANGMAGLESTIDAIRDAGMFPVGTFASSQERSDCGGITLLQAHGMRVAFVALTKGLGNMSLPEDSAGAVNLLYTDYDTNYSNLDTAGITELMTTARRQEPDIIIVLVHWGSEYSREISASQKRLAKLLYDNGANAIIGTHSHMVGPIVEETVTLPEGGERDVVTAYDLGDFYTDSTRPDTQTSAVLKLTFTRNNWTNRVMLTECRYTPVYCADFGPFEPNRYQILSIQNAIDLYEQHFVYRVPDEVYARLEGELESFAEHVSAPEPEE